MKAIALFLFVVFISACDLGSAPIDAETRARIDSLSTARIAQAQLQYDSICRAAMKNELPRLVDSIKKVRLEEIREQLKTVPK